jgi:methyl-accepting chemotaxis protein
MARTVIVFRDTIIERESLAQTQAEDSRAKELRSDTISQTITQFKQSVEGVLGKLRSASSKLEMSSADLQQKPPIPCRRKRAPLNSASAPHPDNVTTAASSVEELAASIGEIASQAAKSTEVAGAVSEAQRTVTTMSQLGSAACPGSAKW